MESQWAFEENNQWNNAHGDYILIYIHKKILCEIYFVIETARRF